MRIVPLLLLLVLHTPLHAQTDKAWNKVRAALDRGKPYGAIRACESQLAGKSPRQEFLVLRAEARNQIGDHEKAIADARDARPVVSAELQQAAALQLGIAHANLGRPDSARHWYTAALDGPADRAARLRLGLLDRTAGRCDDAIQRYDQVLAQQPDHLVALRERGTCKAELGDSTAALRDLERALELAPRDPVNWNSRGYVHLQAGRYVPAIRDFDRAIKLDPNYSFAFNNRGMAYHRLGDTERGLRDITLAARKRRNNPYVYRNFGIIARDQGDTERACRHWRNALDLRFTELYGTEVEELVRTHCGAVPAPAAPKPAAAPAQPTERKTNAPVRSNAP